jgi:hypothetical protein
MEILPMKIRELLTEKIINLTSTEDKLKWVDQVWDILQKSYAPIGGFYTAETPQELIDRFFRWKLVVRDGNVTAVKIEKDQSGRKTTGLGTDGSIQGKNDIRMLMKSDVITGRGWIECSGKPEIIYRKLGALPIPNKFASILLNRPIISFNSDGYHYTRLFGGKPNEEMIFGFAKLTFDDVHKLIDAGLSVDNLPKNIKIEER